MRRRQCQTERVEEVSQTLAELATPFAFVGRVIEGSGIHIVQNGQARHFTEIRCEEDELARMWALSASLHRQKIAPLQFKKFLQTR
jgi:hypothetical protein